MTHALYRHLKKRNFRGIPYNEAVQIFIWIFCTTSILPQSLRRVQIGKEVLIKTFEKLTHDGLILLPPSDGSNEFYGDGIVKWKNVVRAFLLGQIELDNTFPDRVHQYL